MQCQFIWTVLGFPGVATMVGKFTTPDRKVAETVRMLPVVAVFDPFLLLIALSVRLRKLSQFC